MIGFSIISQSNQSGIGCTYTEPQGASFFTFNSSNIKTWLETISHQGPILVSDSRELYRSLLFLGLDYLRELKIFDIKAFFNLYKNSLNTDVNFLGKKFYNIDNEVEIERFKKIWLIQGVKKWDYIPSSLIQVYLNKDAAIAYKVGVNLVNQKLTLEQSIYQDFLKDFLLYMTNLEEVGIFDTKGEKVVPRYEYDHIVTGRLINKEPFCYQTVSKKKFQQTYTSRFGEEGILVIADWRNADFRVAAAMSNEVITGEKKDPYTLLGREIYNKTEISDAERQVVKSEVMAIMYGYKHTYSDKFEKLYPRIAAFKKYITEDAKKTRKVTTKYGKTRYFDARESLETKAFNTLNQMTVADLCKKAVVDCQRVFAEMNLKSVMIPYIVYDNFGFDIYKPELDLALQAIQRGLIEETISHSFRQVVDFEVKISDIYGNKLNAKDSNSTNGLSKSDQS